MSIKIENLSKSFQNGKKVLENINIEVQNGEFICILGPSGCGKSTLLNIIAGLDMPTSGEILIDGKKIIGPGCDRGYIFQDPALFPWLNVIDNVKFGMKINNVSKESQREKAMHYLKMVKLLDYETYRVHELSGGMKQRVALARALSLDSKILLMDEPFAALDIKTKAELSRNLLEIQLQTKKTIIFITHSIEEAFALADRVILFSSDPAAVVREYSPKDKTSSKISAMISESETLLAREVKQIA